MASTLLESSLPGLQLVHRGKVRDLWALADGTLLMVATDRLSAFDVILPEPIPGKGEMLTRISRFWFAATASLMPNHLLPRQVEDVLPAGVDLATYRERSMVVRRLRPLPVEAIARGYLAGSGWNEYRETGAIAGLALPPGLVQADALPEPVFTPSTKAAVGGHDENIGFDAMVALIGGELAEQVRAATLAIYRHAARHAAERGILIADTKLEFGTGPQGELYVMDEMLTPDSSRFWPADEYRPGRSPPSFDKQFVRDWLEHSGWDKASPPPPLPQDVIDGTAERYAEALRRLAGIGPS